MMTGFIRRWLTVGLVGVASLSATISRAQPFRSGAFEWTVAAGGGIGLSGVTSHGDECSIPAAFGLFRHGGHR